MSILDKVKIGNSVQVNLELSRDRLTKETIDAINVSSLGKISDFRMVGVVFCFLEDINNCNKKNSRGDI